MRSLSHRQSPRQKLERLLRRVQQRSATTVPKRVVGRGKDGVELHLRLDGTCPTRAGIDSHATGQVTLQPVQTLSSRGIVGLGQGVELFSAAVRVDRQEPRELVRGTTQEVSIFGRGFRHSQTWQYLSPPTDDDSERPNPKVTIEHVDPIDDREHRLLIHVDANAELLESGPLAFDLSGRRPGPPDQPTRLSGRAEDFYGIGEPSKAFYAYWATFHGEAVWLAAELDGEGVVTRWLGELEREVDLDVDLQISRCAPVLADGSGRVSPGSLLQPFSDQLYCLDFEAGVRHVAEWTGQHVAGGAVWQDEVFAVVHETRTAGVTARCQLVRLAPDLASSGTVAQIELDVGGTAEIEWFDAVGVAISPEGAWAAVEWADFGTQSFGQQTCVLPLSGEPRQAARTLGESAGPSSLGLPYGPGGAVRGSQHWQGGLGHEFGDEAWRRFTAQDWGPEGGPGLGENIITWDGAFTRSLTLANPDGPLLEIPAAEHPELGPVGRPTLLFPAS